MHLCWTSAQGSVTPWTFQNEWNMCASHWPWKEKSLHVLKCDRGTCCHCFTYWGKMRRAFCGNFRLSALISSRGCSFLSLLKVKLTHAGIKLSVNMYEPFGIVAVTWQRSNDNETLQSMQHGWLVNEKARISCTLCLYAQQAKCAHIKHKCNIMQETLHRVTLRTTWCYLIIIQVTVFHVGLGVFLKTKKSRWHFTGEMYAGLTFTWQMMQRLWAASGSPTLVGCCTHMTSSSLSNTEATQPSWCCT